MVIGDSSTLIVSGCIHDFINATNIGVFLPIPRDRPILLSIYSITDSKKKVNFYLDQLVIKDIDYGFKVVTSSYYDVYDHMYMFGKILYSS